MKKLLPLWEPNIGNNGIIPSSQVLCSAPDRCPVRREASTTELSCDDVLPGLSHFVHHTGGDRLKRNSGMMTDRRKRSIG
jgi:hypothetical protein